MSVFPEAPSDTRPGPFGEAPPTTTGILILAGFDIAASIWLLVCTGVGLARGRLHGVDTTVIDAHFWSGWIGHLRGPIMDSIFLGWIAVPVLLIISGTSLFGVRARSQPRVFRVLLGGTIGFTLAVAAYVTLGWLGLVDYGSID
jgi:hypothetical protein